MRLRGWMDGSDRGQTPGFWQRAGPAPRRSPHTAQMRVSPQPMGYPVGVGIGAIGVHTSGASSFQMEALPASLPLEPTHVRGGHGHVLGRDNTARTNPERKAHQGWHTPPAPWPLQTDPSACPRQDFRFFWPKHHFVFSPFFTQIFTYFH